MKKILFEKKQQQQHQAYRERSVCVCMCQCVRANPKEKEVFFYHRIQQWPPSNQKKWIQLHAQVKRFRSICIFPFLIFGMDLMNDDCDGRHNPKTTENTEKYYLLNGNKFKKTYLVKVDQRKHFFFVSLRLENDFSRNTSDRERKRT